MEQIKQIIAEIERLKVEIPYHENAWSVLNKLEVFINSLPATEEQSSEDLEYLATSLEETIGTSPHSRETILDHLKQAAQWQKEKMMESSIDAKIINDEMMVECEQGCLVLEPLTYPIGQKLKILIIEEDEQ